MRTATVSGDGLTELDFTEQLARVPPRVEDEPITPSACPVCKTPTKRRGALCASCRVAA